MVEAGAGIKSGYRRVAPRERWIDSREVKVVCSHRGLATLVAQVLPHLLEKASREVCVSDRKYRQPGYQDSGRGESKSRGPETPRPRTETFGPRALNMPGKRTVSRCAQCGTVLQMITEPIGKCPKCGFELHSCKQCTHFDPSQRFECLQPVPERIAKKDARNDCKFYSISVRVEKQTSTGSAGPSSPNDARKAFDSLFKD